MAVLIEIFPVFAVLFIAFVATAIDRKRAGADEEDEDAGEVFALFVDNENKIRGRRAVAAAPSTAEPTACGEAGVPALPQPRREREHSAPVRLLTWAAHVRAGVPA